MQTEIEAKFLNVNHDEIREKLKARGATLEQPIRLMRRKNFDIPGVRTHSWARVRDEGNKVTVSYKQVDEKSVLGTKEINVTVDNFDRACSLLEALGLEQKSYQETKRESWRLGDVEIELDEWPWLEPLVEIEAPTEKMLWDTAELFGLGNNEILHGAADGHYAHVYDVTEDEVNKWLVIDFSVVPDWLEAKRKQ